MIADYEGDIRHLFEMAPQGEVPILATRNMVLFPGVIAPILVGRPASFRLVRKYQEDSDAIIGIFCQKDPSMDTPSGNDLYEYGVYAKIIRVLEMPGPSNNITAIVQGLGKCRSRNTVLTWLARRRACSSSCPPTTTVSSMPPSRT